MSTANLSIFRASTAIRNIRGAVPYFIHRMDLLDMKRNLNCTALRPGQYCSGPEVFALADSLGLITFAELPNVKNRPFSPEAQWMQTVEMVRRLRNSPSVLLFDMGDETDRAADSRWAYMESPGHFITCRHCEGSGGRFVDITPEELRMSKMLRCAVRGWYGDDEKPLRPDNQQWTSNDEFRHQIALRGKKTGKVESRIRPTLETGSIITDTRANIHYLCTEYGCVNLKGLTSWEKAEALISVAHPDFRDELIAEAEKLHIWRRSNKR